MRRIRDLFTGTIISATLISLAAATAPAAIIHGPAHPATILGATIALPAAHVDPSVTNFTQPVLISEINAADNLVAFQGDLTFDSTVVTFQSEPVSNAGLTSGDWNVSANVLPGTGPIRTLRISAFSTVLDTPLSGSGTLFNLNLIRVSSIPGASTQLTWVAPPDDFIFYDANLDILVPSSAPHGSITISSILPATVSLPAASVDLAETNFTQPVLVSEINAADNLVAFQGDFTFDSTVVTFQSQPVSNAGLTSGDWNVSANVLPGTGPIRTLRISAFSTVLETPLSGSGTLFHMNLIRISNTPGASTELTWAAPPDDFIFYDANLNTHVPSSTPPGRLTIETILPATVSLPVASVDLLVTNFTQPVLISEINATDNLIAFQGDFAFDSTVITFQNEPVSNAGLTSGDWNVSGNVLPGTGPIRTLRISAFSTVLDTPLSGSGTLFNLNLIRISSTPGVITPLTWTEAPDDFIFYDANLNIRVPSSTPPGSITIRATTLHQSGNVTRLNSNR